MMSKMIILIFLIVIQSVLGSFQPVQVLCEINGYLVQGMVDTGAEISVMSSSCAKRCRIANLIDTQHSGKAIGVGSSDIVGGIDNLGMRIGPLNFQNKVSILRNSRCDLLIGLDILERFQCEVSLKEKIVKFNVRGDQVKVPMSSNRNTYYPEQSPKSEIQLSKHGVMPASPLRHVHHLRKQIPQDDTEAERNIASEQENSMLRESYNSSEFDFNDDENEEFSIGDENVSLEGV
jgi:hypothetical protein